MAPLKFRAWHKEDKDMVHDVQEGYRLSQLEDRYWVVMQSTGLSDKNGVEIYEGDIVTEWYKPWHDTDEPRQGEPHTVEWYDHGFYLSDVSHSNFEATRCEVIGNIYQNPDLLPS